MLMVLVFSSLITGNFAALNLHLTEYRMGTGIPAEALYVGTDTVAALASNSIQFLPGRYVIAFHMSVFGFLWISEDGSSVKYNSGFIYVLRDRPISGYFEWIQPGDEDLSICGVQGGSTLAGGKVYFARAYCPASSENLGGYHIPTKNCADIYCGGSAICKTQFEVLTIKGFILTLTPVDDMASLETDGPVKDCDKNTCMKITFAGGLCPCDQFSCRMVKLMFDPMQVKFDIVVYGLDPVDSLKIKMPRSNKALDTDGREGNLSYCSSSSLGNNVLFHCTCDADCGVLYLEPSAMIPAGQDLEITICEIKIADTTTF